MPVPSSVRALIALCAMLLAVVLVPATASAAVVGVQTHLLWGSADSAEMDRQLDLARGAGARMVRVDAGWASFEPTGKGQHSAWYLGKMDQVVAKAEARGLQVLFTVWETPCWASSAPAALKQDCTGAWWDRDVQRYAPEDPQDFADAMAFLVRRYGTRVAGYEVWNEPNATHYFKAADPAAAYASLLKAAYPAAKAADPRVKVIGGSLMWADMGFTQQLYAHGIKGAFDAWSIHPYSDDRSALDKGDDRWLRGSFVRGVPAVRDVLLRHGDDKPLWLTEFGWSTTSTRGPSAWLNGVSEATQAAYTREAVEQLARWPYVEVGIYFNLKDTGTDPASTIENFGLVEADGTPKPAYHALRAGAAVVHGGQVPPTPGADASRTGTTGTGTGSRIAADATRAGSPAGSGSEPGAAGAGTAATSPARPSGTTARATAKRRAKVRRLRVTRVRGGLRVSGVARPRARVTVRVELRRNGRRAGVVVVRAVAGRTGAFKRTLRSKRIARTPLRVSAMWT